ncbi:MAG: hypothetical protein KIT31_23295 [Deltaproteobacteria bacterium]|nr:hypothetical protein [Deltaproteobacteria bacterium]
MVPFLSALALVQVAGAAQAQPADPYGRPRAPAPNPNPAPTPAPKTPAAGPSDPYGPTAPADATPGGATAPLGPTQPSTPATPPPSDAVLAEQVAAALVQRAQELFDAKVLVDAKQLAVEALQKSPKGAAADQARFLIKSINQQLGIKDDQPPAKIEDQVDLTPIEDPTLAKSKQKVDTAPEVPTARSNRIVAGVHAGAYFGLIGATVGSFFSEDNAAGGAIPVGLAAGLAAGVYFPRVFDKLDWNEAQVRTAGSGTVWGGVIGGLFADVANVSKPSAGVAGTTGREVLVGSAIGSTLGGLGGSLLATRNNYSVGDLALVDTFAGIGAVGGLTIGMLMQPAETEAYSLNSVFGIAGGVIVGLVAAPQTNTTPRRMLRVAGLSAAGGAVPFLLYAGIRTNESKADERVVGLLSSAGLVAGAWLGFRLTRGMDEGADVSPGKSKKSDADAPPSILSRSSSGRWDVGILTVQPLSPELAPQRGMSIPLLGGAF